MSFSFPIFFFLMSTHPSLMFCLFLPCLLSYFFVIKQLVARGVKVAVGAVGGAAPPAAPPAQPPDSTPQEAASKATPSSRPTTPVISMTAALKDVGAVSHPSHFFFFFYLLEQPISWLCLFFFGRFHQGRVLL